MRAYPREVKYMINKIRAILEDKKEGRKSLVDLINAVYLYDDEIIHIISDDMYMDIIERKTKDIANIDISEEEEDVLKEAMMYKMVDNIKIVFLNFQNSADEQRKYYKALYDSTSDIVRKRWLKRSLNELESLEKSTERKGFYYFIFDEKKDKLLEKRKNILDILEEGAYGRVRLLSFDEKVKVLEKAFNPHEKLFI